MRIPDEIVTQIYEAANILDVVSTYVSNLKKTGANYVGLSPFKNERTPSFYVLPNLGTRGVFKCHSTGIGGDVITFIMEKEGVGYREALELLAEQYNITIPEKSDDANEQQHKDKQALTLVLQESQKWFRTQLGLSPFLTSRNLGQEVADLFGLGVAPDSWDGLSKYLLSNSYTEDALVKSGMVMKRPEGQLYDRFRGRIMFPLRDVYGKMVGFAGRNVSSEQGRAKYVNSPETELYQKRKVLYGLYENKSEIQRNDRCYVVEGYTDVLAMRQYGLPFAVAASGATLSAEQVQLVLRFTKQVTLVFDSDNSGARATRTAIELFLARGVAPKVLHLPHKEDPDSFLQKVGKAGFEAFEEEHTQDFMAYLIGDVASYESQELLQKAKELASMLANVPDSLDRSVLIQRAATLLQIAPDILNTKITPFTPEPSKGGDSAKEELSSIEYKEAQICSLLLAHGHTLVEVVRVGESNQFYLRDLVLQQIPASGFKHTLHDNILKCAHNYGEADSNVLDVVLEYADTETRNYAVDLAARSFSGNDLAATPGEQFHALLKGYFDMLLDELLQELIQGFTHENMDEYIGKQQALLQKKDELAVYFRNTMFR